MKIIANHAHLLLPHDGTGWWPEGNSEMLIEHLDVCGIDKVVVFPPFACQMDDDMEKANMWALDEVAKHSDRFIAAGTLNPIADNVISLLDTLYEAGVRLIKIHPSVDTHDISDPAADDFYRRAEELGVLLNYHTGPHGTKLSNATPYKYDDILWKYPKLKMNFEHIGGRPFRELFLAIIFNLHNRAFGGVTSILSYETARAWYMGPEILQDFIEIAGADNFIFGLDFPWHSAEVNKKDIELIQGMTISQESKAKILGGNICKLLGVSCS